MTAAATQVLRDGLKPSPNRMAPAPNHFMTLQRGAENWPSPPRNHRCNKSVRLDLQNQPSLPFKHPHVHQHLMYALTLGMYLSVQDFHVDHQNPYGN